MGNPAPRPGSTRRIKNFEAFKCQHCGQIHLPGTVWISRLYTTQGWFTEFHQEDCPNAPLPPAPPPVDKHADGKTAQERSDALFNARYKPYGF